MKGKIPPLIGKILYGALFIVVLPALLVAWAASTESSVSLPGVYSPSIGFTLMAVGIAIMFAGMAAIYLYGNGLPMNAYPPEKFVTRGIFRVLHHPIYTGFCLACLGAAVAMGSRSGLWLVFPAVVLGCVALVQGFEKEATHALFGRVDARPLIHLPVPQLDRPSASDRISAYVLAVGPWLMLVRLTELIPAAPVLTVFGHGQARPLPSLAAAMYLSGYALILLVPLAVSTSQALREYVVTGLAVSALALLILIAFPAAVPQADLAARNLLGDLPVMEVALSGTGVFFLSSFTAWTLLSARLLPAGFRIVGYVWASLVAISGLLIGRQAPATVLAGVAIFLVATRLPQIWELLRKGTEHVANSWAEWRFGPVRVINHGLYAAAGAFASVSVIGILTGPEHVGFVIMIAAMSIVVSALSAQWIEGSPKLLRPYGWYGGVLGSFIGGFIAYAMGADIWLLIAAFCVGAPIVQSAGRLRCLVQGCCHGRPVEPWIGIRYTHPRSRVCRLADLKGVPVHPTPLYSILYNLVILLILTRLWFSGAPLALIFGVYYIFTGLGRFVEESLRGEPQTPKYGGLRLYQLLALVSVAGGIFVTMVGGPATAPSPRFSWLAIAASGVFAFFIWLAFGVDLPKSNKRFARLTTDT